MSKWRGGIIRSTQITPGGSDEQAAASGVWRASDAAYWVRQGQWPTPAAADPYFPYNTLLLNGNGLHDARNNTFIDSSSVYSTVARTGNPTQGSFTPYGSNWSNYFDGSGDNLSLSGNSAFSIATSSTPFTIESWIYPTAAGGCIFSESYTGAGDTVSISVIMADGSTAETNGQYVTLGFYNGSAWSLTRANTQVSLNTWTHIACVFTGSTSKIYYNGVDVTASSPITSWGVTGDAGDAWYVGQRWDTTGTAYFRGFISNLRFVNGSAVYTSAFTPPTSPLTAISGTALLTCQSNRFRDASTNNFAVTRNGDTRVTESSPFAVASRASSPFAYYNQDSVPSWSNYFDGTGDNLTISNFSSSMSLGTSDFTIEFWVYPSTGPNNNWSPFMTIGNSGGGQEIRLSQNINGTGWGWLYPNNSNNADSYTGYGTLPINQWHHIAMVRSGSTLYLFRNGTQVATATSISFNHTNTTLFRVAMPQTAYADGTFNGYISNLRIVKGTALYTSAFTPPTSQLTAVSGTVMLTCQSPALTDRSSLTQTFTVNGDVVPVGFSPFNGTGNYSAYFDGSGDFLTMPSSSQFAFGTGDYTIEGWFFTGATGTERRIVYFNDDRNNVDVTSSNTIIMYDGAVRTFGTPTPNAWNHFAISRASGTVRCYLNGVLGYSGTESSNTSTRTMYIGATPAGNGPFNGYISNIRVVKGTAVYSGASLTVPTSPLTAISGTALLALQDGRFVDNSTNAHAITISGDAKTQTFNPFTAPAALTSTGSMYFDGSGDYLTSPSNPAQIIGTGDFTYEMWVYPLSIPTYSDASFLVDNRNQINFCIYLASNALWFYNGGTEYNGGTVSINAWNHLVICRSSGTTRGFVNGVQAFSFTDSSNYGQMGQFIGARYTGATQYLNGYISNLRFITGTALYTSAFTPPTSPVLPTSNTKFQLEGMNAAIADLTSTNNIETGGTTRVNTSIKKYGSGSMYFDGSSWLYTPSKPENFFRTGNFTIEGWFYYLNASTNVDNGMFGNYLSGWGTDTIYWGKHTTYGGKVALWVANYSTGGAMLVDPNLPPANTWVHYAVVRNGNTWTMYRDGTSVATQTYSGDPMLLKGDYVVGRADATAQFFYGYMDDFRITKYARYTSNFTPSTSALPTR